jgi:hypothetical protein
MAGATDQVSYLRHFVHLLTGPPETTAYVVGRYLHRERLSAGVCLLHRLLQRFDSGELALRMIPSMRCAPVACLLAATITFAAAAELALAGGNTARDKSSGKFRGMTRQHGPGKTGQGGTGSGASPGLGIGSGMGSAGSGHSVPGGQSHPGASKAPRTSSGKR